MKQFVYIMSVALLLIVPVLAEQPEFDILIFSDPLGIEVYIDDRYVGNTYLSVQLPSGEYTIRMSLEGFRDWEQTVTVTDSTSISAVLEGEGDLNRVAYQRDGMTLNGFWYGDRYIILGQPFLVYNAETHELSTEDELPGYLKRDVFIDQFIGTRLELDESTIGRAFISPSGRYVTYEVVNLISTTMGEGGIGWRLLYIYDTELERSYETQARTPLHEPIDPTHFMPIWSANEQAIYLWGSGCTFVFINDNHTTDGCIVGNFIDTETGETYTPAFMHSFFPGVSETGLVVIWNAIRDTHRTSTLWVADIASRTVRRLPFLREDVYGVRFSADGNMLYIAHREGISRIDVQQETLIPELISDVISGQWYVHTVDFSPSLEYALIASGHSEIPDSIWAFHFP